MKNFIIGIHCNNEKVKAVCINMLNYILSKGIYAANYNEYNELTQDARINDNRCIAFVDKYIDTFCMLYNNSRNEVIKAIKANKYYCFNTGQFIDHNVAEICVAKAHLHNKILSFEDVANVSIADRLIKANKRNMYLYASMPVIFSAIDIALSKFDRDALDNSTIKAAADEAEISHVCIITDVDSIGRMRKVGSIDRPSLYGEFITIKYDDTLTDIVEDVQHTVIDIRGKSLMIQFYILLSYCQTLLINN